MQHRRLTRKQSSTRRHIILLVKGNLHVRPVMIITGLNLILICWRITKPVLQASINQIITLFASFAISRKRSLRRCQESQVILQTTWIRQISGMIIIVPGVLVLVILMVLQGSRTSTLHKPNHMWWNIRWITAIPVIIRTAAIIRQQRVLRQNPEESLTTPTSQMSHLLTILHGSYWIMQTGTIHPWTWEVVPTTQVVANATRLSSSRVTISPTVNLLIMYQLAEQAVWNVMTTMTLHTTNPLSARSWMYLQWRLRCILI